MYFQRYYLECLSHASYMVADEETGIAAVIDPQRDIDIYVEDAREHGFKIEHVIPVSDTHLTLPTIYSV